MYFHVITRQKKKETSTEFTENVDKDYKNNAQTRKRNHGSNIQINDNIWDKQTVMKILSCRAVRF